MKKWSVLLMIAVLVMLGVGCSRSNEFGSIEFYAEATKEGISPESVFHVVLSEEDAGQLVQIITGIENWTDDRLVDRIAFYFNGELKLVGNDTVYYFQYEDNIVYANMLFAQISEADMNFIRSLDTSAE